MIKLKIANFVILKDIMINFYIVIESSFEFDKTLDKFVDKIVFYGNKEDCINYINKYNEVYSDKSYSIKKIELSFKLIDIEV